MFSGESAGRFYPLSFSLEIFIMYFRQSGGNGHADAFTGHVEKFPIADPGGRRRGNG